MAVKLAPPAVSLQPLGEHRVLASCLDPHSSSAYPDCRCHLLQEAIHAFLASHPDSGLYLHCLCLWSHAGFQFPEGQSNPLRPVISFLFF